MQRTFEKAEMCAWYVAFVKMKEPKWIHIQTIQGEQALEKKDIIIAHARITVMLAGGLQCGSTCGVQKTTKLR